MQDNGTDRLGIFINSKSPMKDYTIENRKSYIYVRIKTGQSLQLFKELIFKLKDKTDQLNCSKVLIDLRESKGQLSAAEKYELGELPFDKRIFGIKWAYVDIPKKRADGFVGLVASNRGVEASLFFNMDEAVGWLTGDFPEDKK